MLRGERLSGGMWGLLIGDAAGVPYEFKAPQELPAFELIDLQPPAGFVPARPDVPPGTWSDDGAQALCLLQSLLICKRLSEHDLAIRLLSWMHQGHLAVDRRVFDVGIQTRAALDRLNAGVPAAEAGPSRERDNGNGSLMRVLPLALWHRGDDAELIELAARQSRVTHGHLRSQLCCALYCLFARATLEGEADAWESAVTRMKAVIRERPEWERELHDHVLTDAPAGGSGYVVDCLYSARHALQGVDYADVVRRAIALGHDTDTTACVAGGIAGIRFGESGIPAAWRCAAGSSRRGSSNSSCFFREGHSIPPEARYAVRARRGVITRRHDSGARHRSGQQAPTSPVIGC
jgi:ADP-ribosylglycohydrolase